VVPPETPNSEVCTAPLIPVTHTSELLTITDGLDAVAAVVALSMTVLLVLVPVVLDDTVLDEELTVLELLDTVLDEELTVLPTVVFVTVSVANAGNAQNISAMTASSSAAAANALTIVLPLQFPTSELGTKQY
jgi:hypothetical protein